MSILLLLTIFIAVIAASSWVFRFIGQTLARSAPFFRDMSYGVAYGYTLGAALLILFASIYFAALTAEPDNANNYFFMRVAIESFIGFVIIAYYFRLAGKYVGSEGSRKHFRTMPLTAAFGIITILLYVFVAVFAGQTSSMTIIVLATLGVPHCIYAQSNFRAGSAKLVFAIVGAILLVFTVTHILQVSR